MGKNELSECEPMVAIRNIILQYPEVEEGESCVNRAFKVRKKTFVFMGMDESSYHVRLKLQDSLAEAEQLEEKSPERYSVGGHGWTSIKLPHSVHPPKGLMERWIEESFLLLVPKKIVAQMPASMAVVPKPTKKK